MENNKKKILIVEDDVYIREVYVEVLTDSGFEVEQAQDGQEGLVKASKGGYDLILLDIMTPRLDGIGFLRALKDNPADTQNGPIVMLTNLAHDPVIQQGIEFGATSYIIKSDITPDQLVERVKTFLG